MGYVEQVLQPGETVRYVTGVSWAGYLPGLLLWLLAVILLIEIAPWRASAGWALVGWIAIAAAFLAGAVLLIKHGWQRCSVEIELTNRRVLYKDGFIRRHTFEMHLDKVESVEVEQSILGRLLNYGDLTIRGTGDTMERAVMIDRPLEFRNHVTAA